MDETTRAYLAGFFDGEGCIMAYRFNRTPAYLKKHPAADPGGCYYVVRIQVAQKDRACLERLRKDFGGWTGGMMRDKYGQWQLHSVPEVRRFLLAVLPYLRVKKAQAEKALELLDTMRERRHRGVRLTDAEKANRDRLVEEIKQLKRAA